MLLYTTLYEIPEFNFGRALLLYSEEMDVLQGNSSSAGELNFSTIKEKSRLVLGNTSQGIQYQSTTPRKLSTSDRLIEVNTSLPKAAHASPSPSKNYIKHEKNGKPGNSKVEKIKRSQIGKICRSSSVNFNEREGSCRPLKPNTLDAYNQYELGNVSHISPDQATMPSISDSLTPCNTTTVSQVSGLDASGCCEKK